MLKKSSWTFGNFTLPRKTPNSKATTMTMTGHLLTTTTTTKEPLAFTSSKTERKKVKVILSLRRK
jgi:hypothetical protein